MDINMARGVYISLMVGGTQKLRKGVQIGDKSVVQYRNYGYLHTLLQVNLAVPSDFTPFFDSTMQQLKFQEVGGTRGQAQHCPRFERRRDLVPRQTPLMISLSHHFKSRKLKQITQYPWRLSIQDVRCCALWVTFCTTPVGYSKHVSNIRKRTICAVKWWPLEIQLLAFQQIAFVAMQKHLCDH